MRSGLLQKNRYTALILVILFLIASFVRIYPLATNQDSFSHLKGYRGDSVVYHHVAYSLLHGKGFVGSDAGNKSAVRGPTYPLFIAGVYKLFGGNDSLPPTDAAYINFYVLFIVQALLDAAISIIIFFIVRLLYQKSIWPAIISSLMYCFSWYNIYYTSAVLSESLTSFLLTLFILFTLLAISKSKKYLWIIAGLLLGVIIMTRTEYILFVPVLLMYILMLYRKQIRVAFIYSLVLIGSVILIMIPWVVRNYVVFDKFIPISAGSVGYNLFLGTYESRNYEWLVMEMHPDKAFESAEEKILVEELTSSYLYYIRRSDIRISEVDNQFKEIAINKISANTLDVLTNWFRKMPYLWYPTSTRLFHFERTTSLWLTFYFSSFAFAILFFKKNKMKLVTPIILIFIYLNFVFLPFHVETRYGVPLLPSIISLAGIGVWGFGQACIKVLNSLVRLILPYNKKRN